MGQYKGAEELDETREARNKSQLAVQIHDNEGRLNMPNPVKITSNLNTLEYAANYKYGQHFEDLKDD